MSRYSRERLIDEVKKYPVLYDTKHEHHRDIDVRDRCWQEIGERIGANSESLKREWKILRDSLRQAVKRTGAGAARAGAQAGAAPKRWRFQSRMAYILPYVTFRGRRDVKRIKTDDHEEQRSDRERSREPEAWEPARGPEEAAGEAGGADDALELFFASVCQSSKRLPRRHQATLKRRVLDALLSAEEDADADDAKPFGNQA